MEGIRRPGAIADEPLESGAVSGLDTDTYSGPGSGRLPSLPENPIHRNGGQVQTVPLTHHHPV
jgi:hypothetical protein